MPSTQTYGTSQGLMLSTGTIQNHMASAPILYTGVPNPQPPAQIVAASIKSIVQGSTTTTFPPDLDATKFPTMQLNLFTFTGQNAMNSSVSGTPIGQGSWILPLPMKGLVDSSVVNFDPGSILETIKGVTGENGDKANFVSKAVSAVIGVADKVTKIAGAAGGFALNPWRVLNLVGPDYKKFSLTWTFSPENAQESVALNNLIATLRNAQAVPLVAGMVYGMPYMVQPVFYGPERQFTFAFKKAFIEGMAVSYSPDNSGWFHPQSQGSGHAPMVVVLELNLIECELWLQSDFSAIQGTSSSTGQILDNVGSSATQTFGDTTGGLVSSVTSGTKTVLGQ